MPESNPGQLRRQCFWTVPLIDCLFMLEPPFVHSLWSLPFFLCQHITFLLYFIYACWCFFYICLFILILLYISFFMLNDASELCSFYILSFCFSSFSTLSLPVAVSFLSVSLFFFYSIFLSLCLTMLLNFVLIVFFLFVLVLSIFLSLSLLVFLFYLSLFI